MIRQHPDLDCRADQLLSKQNNIAILDDDCCNTLAWAGWDLFRFYGGSMWIPFRLNRRKFEWRVNEDQPRYLTVRSCDGEFEAQSSIIDITSQLDGKISHSLVGAPLIVGREFPPGCLRHDPAPSQLNWHGFEMANYGIIHTEFVRSVLERWTHRSRYRTNASR